MGLIDALFGLVFFLIVFIVLWVVVLTYVADFFGSAGIFTYAITTLIVMVFGLPIAKILGGWITGTL